MFTKSDLRSGDVILRRDGSVEILVLPLGVLITRENGWNDLDSIQEDLIYMHHTFGILNPKYDIVAVRRPTEKYHCRHGAFDEQYGDLVYLREEISCDSTDEQQNEYVLSDIEESDDMGEFLSSFFIPAEG